MYVSQCARIHTYYSIIVSYSLHGIACGSGGVEVFYMGEQACTSELQEGPQ